MCEVRRLLTKIYDAKNALRKLDVIRSERFTGELDEWMAETACKGARAKTRTQKGWDVKVVDGSRQRLLQVKAHAKGHENKARRTALYPESLELFDRLIIIVMSEDYCIQQWFEIPRRDVRDWWTQSGEGWLIKWDEVSAFETNWIDLPGGEELRAFAPSASAC